MNLRKDRWNTHTMTGRGHTQFHQVRLGEQGWQYRVGNYNPDKGTTRYDKPQPIDATRGESMFAECERYPGGYGR